MLEDVWEGYDDESFVPPDPEPQPWEAEDFDAWIDELAALDPERELTVAEILHAAEHGPVAQIPLAALAGLDPASLSDGQRIAVAVAGQRIENHGVGVRLRATAAFAGPVAPTDTRSLAAFAWTDLAGALHVGEGTARAMAVDARRLGSHLPDTLTAMVSGALSWTKARTLLDATREMNREQCAAVQAKVLPEAAQRNNKQHSSAVGYHCQKIDPDSWRKRRDRKLADVALIRDEHGDGVADLLIRHLDSSSADTLWTAADTWARQQKASGDTRTLDALRVAALVDWAQRYLTGTPIRDGQQPDPAPTRHGMPVTVNVLIDLATLLAAATGDTSGVARLASGPTLPATDVADLLHQQIGIRFALLDHNGQLTGVSGDRHDPSALLRLFIALRDITLRTPGGSTTVIAGQDLDHLDEDGPTSPGNLHAPSRGWHRAKTFKHWTVTANPDGTITWTSRRTGRTYTTHPYNYRDGP